MTQTSRNSEGESQDWFLPTWGSYDEQIKTPGHFHSRPELPAGKTSLLPDTGAHSSLTGDRFAHAQAALAQEHGHASSQNRLPEIRRVRGVGSGSKECEYSCTVPVGLVTTDGEHFVDSFTAPTVNDSEIPGLLGIDALKRMDALIRCKTGDMLFLGKGGVKLEVSPGTKHFQMVEAMSGHWLLPVHNFDKKAVKTDMCLQTEATGDEKRVRFEGVAAS